MCEDDVLRATGKAAANPIGQIFIRQVAQTREDALLQLPGIIVAGFEHVAAMVRLHYDRGATTQTFSDQSSDVTKVHHGGDLHAVVRCGETEIVDGVMRNRERMKIDLADFEIFARLDLFDAIAQGLGAPACSSFVTLNFSLTYASSV